MPINSELAPGTKAYKAEYDRARRARLKDEIAEKKRAYVLANFDKEQARVKAWVEANRVRSTEIKREWKARNPDADRQYRAENHTQVLATKAAYRARRPEVHRLGSSRRRKGVAHATPLWADRAAIKTLYISARERGLQVDHVVPLKGELVCGLHVENNLQLLTQPENARKGNKHAD